MSTPPGPTGFVRHTATRFDTWHFWLGCGPAFPSGVDGERDGKWTYWYESGQKRRQGSFVGGKADVRTNLGIVGSRPSVCHPARERIKREVRCMNAPSTGVVNMVCFKMVAFV